MSQKWFFYSEGDVITLRTRIEAEGAIGDAEEQIRPDAEIPIPGLTYDALKTAGSGVLEIADDGTFTIIPDAEGR